MSGKTNELVAWVSEAAPLYDPAEYDAVVASGELVTAGLLAIVLKSMGINARSWRAGRSRSTPTTRMARRASPASTAPRSSRGSRRGQVAVVAGFQGLHADERPRHDARPRRLRHLRRRARRRARSAERCDIYTDVDGVYTTDPRVVPRARRLDRVSFEEMLEMASLGAKVLQVRSVEVAMVHRVKLMCVHRSTIPPIPKSAR